MEQQAFEDLATIYPHEMYEKFPEQFWRYFQTQCPNVSREEMERTLSEAA